MNDETEHHGSWFLERGRPERCIVSIGAAGRSRYHPSVQQVIEADLTWTGTRFEPGIRISVDGNGRITAAGSIQQAPTLRLGGQALLPGFVNAHSHAFQRKLRGRGEHFPDGSGSFWSWREAMYADVARFDAESLHAASLLAFTEMRAAGITSVGEFHYLHHLDDDGRRYELDAVVLNAAAEAGIRIVLLNTFYRTGAIGAPLQPDQRRFESRNVEEYLDAVARLMALEDTQSFGIVAHSIRAVPLDDIEALHRWAVAHQFVFHMHVEEQRAEIEACLSAYGKTPLALLNDRMEIGPEFTAVHCTHSRPVDLERFLEGGGNVCITPLTEANLGDGIPELPARASLQDQFALGTDSNARISMIEEMRWLEYGQRLRTESRGVLRDESGHAGSRLLRAATTAGARSLGLQTGQIAPGMWADFISISLATPELEGWSEDSLLDAIIFGASNEVIVATAVAGRWKQHRQ